MAPAFGRLGRGRPFATDSSQRNRAIQNFVPQTGQHECITFTPTGLLGLPDGASAGGPVPLQVVEYLTIGGVTREATFDATVTFESANRLEGNAVYAQRPYAAHIGRDRPTRPTGSSGRAGSSPCWP